MAEVAGSSAIKRPEVVHNSTIGQNVLALDHHHLLQKVPRVNYYRNHHRENRSLGLDCYLCHRNCTACRY